MDHGDHSGRRWRRDNGEVRGQPWTRPVNVPSTPTNQGLDGLPKRIGEAAAHVLRQAVEGLAQLLAADLVEAVHEPLAVWPDADDSDPSVLGVLHSRDELPLHEPVHELTGGRERQAQRLSKGRDRLRPLPSQGVHDDDLREREPAFVEVHRALPGGCSVGDTDDLWKSMAGSLGSNLGTGFGMAP